MLLPSELRSTTLGDVLGALSRERVTGVLELIDRGGVVHRVHLRDGLVGDVETPGAQRIGDVLRRTLCGDARTSRAIERYSLADGQRPLGRVLVQREVIGEADLTSALCTQRLERLEALYRLQNARLAFRVARRQMFPPPRPLAEAEFLHGRPRRRQQVAACQRQVPIGSPPASPDDHESGLSQTQREALSVLGLDERASRETVRAAFRQQAARVHPDRHVDKNEVERARMSEQFVRFSAAYRTLVA
jgi:DnaJ-domain-containing protein 1